MPVANAIFYSNIRRFAGFAQKVWSERILTALTARQRHQVVTQRYIGVGDASTKRLFGATVIEV